MDRASLDQLLGRGLSLAEIGRRYGLHESAVSYWVCQHGLQAANAEKHLARGGIPREALVPLVESGATLAEIARAVHRSKATVRHWLARYGLKTINGPGRRAAAEVSIAKAAGLAIATMLCRHHGETEFWLDGRGVYRCKRCRSQAVTRRRRRVKEILVQEAGGACCLCGYSSNMRALHFHHLDPSNKRLEINAKGVSLSLERLRAEARKCVLLCSNCHAEVEDGVVSVPADAQMGAPPG